MAREAIAGLRSGVFSQAGAAVMNQVLHGRKFSNLRDQIPGPQDRPSAAINTQPINASQLAAPVSNQLTQFTGPGGTVDWAGAIRAGAVTPEMQVHLQNAGVWDQIQAGVSNPSQSQIADQRYTDADRALAAAEDFKGLADSFAGDIQSGMAANRDAINTTSQGINAGFQDTKARADAALGRADQMAGQVQANNASEAANFAAFQKEQMGQLQEIITSGLRSIGTEQAAALSSITENMAADISATTGAAAANMRNQLAELESNPDMAPEAKAGIGAQVRIATAQQAGRDVAPIRRMYRELETTTRTNFGNMLTQFNATGVSATSSLQGAQQSTRGYMSIAHAAQYQATLDSAAKIGEGLTNIMATAEANRSMAQANLDATRVQLEATGNSLLLSVLPMQATPFITTSELMQAAFDDNIETATLQWNEQIATFNMQQAELGLEIGTQTAMVPAFAPAAETPKKDNGVMGLVSSGVTGGAGIVGASIIATAVVCIDGNSLVETLTGPLPLADVRVGMRVRNAFGCYPRVVAKHFRDFTGDSSHYAELMFGGSYITASYAHVVNGHTTREWVEAGLPHRRVIPKAAGDLLLEDGSAYMANGHVVSSLLKPSDIPFLMLIEPENQIPCQM